MTMCFSQETWIIIVVKRIGYTMNKENKGIIARYVKIIVVFAVIAGSSSGIFGSVITAPALAIGFWRLTIGTPFFAAPVLVKQRETLKQISKKNLILTFLSGAFLFGHFFSWFTCVKMTDIASAVVLATLHPLVVIIATIFVFHKKVGRRPIMGIIVALLGGTLIAGLDINQLSSGNFMGDVLAFLAAVFMGIYFVIGGEVRKEVPGSTYVFLLFLSCWICFAIGVIVTGTPILGYSVKDYILIIGLTFVCQIGAHAVLNLCMGHVDSLYVSAWESGEAVFAIILGMIFLKQFPESMEIIGAVITVIGLLYYNYYTGIAEKEQ